MNGVFDTYAEYYDLLYEGKDYQGESQFVAALLTQQRVLDEGALLELGCGTGKHGQWFARMGYSIHGVDLSEAMIDVAKARVPSDISTKMEFSVGDVRVFRVAKTFDAVISLFHVASYQTTNDDLLAMFETASAHLKSGGVFLFDCWYGPAVLSERPVVRVKRIENAEINLVRIAEPVMHVNENVVDVNYTVQVRKKGREEHVVEINETHSVRYLFKPEVEMMLDQSSMKLIKCVEWMTGDSPGLGSWAVTFVAEKRG
jgi:SAM-dependent methyltransferase